MPRRAIPETQFQAPEMAVEALPGWMLQGKARAEKRAKERIAAITKEVNAILARAGYNG